MTKHTIRELDRGQLDIMWDFMKLNPRSSCIKDDVRLLREALEAIRQAMVQKTGGERSNDPAGYVDDLGTYINSVVISDLWLHIHGALNVLEDNLPERLEEENEKV